MKNFIAILIVTAMFFTCPTFAFAADTDVYAAYNEESKYEKLYDLEDAGEYKLFTNHVDGYSLYVDHDMTVDMSRADIVTVLENDTKRIEVYKQSLKGIYKAAYVNYSNGFLNNTISHKLYYNSEQTINGIDVHITSWERNKLDRVENDKNNYVSLDFEVDNYVYTIMIKSEIPIYLNGGYTYLIENFEVVAATQQPIIEMTSKVDVVNRGWNEETEEFYDWYFSDSAELSWGIFEPGVGYTGYDQLNMYEEYFNYEFPFVLNYSEVVNTSPDTIKNWLEGAYEKGKTVELTLQTVPSSGNMVYNLLNGAYDKYLCEYARVIAEFGHPVLFRPFNEMNGDWCAYSSYNTSKDTMIYKEMYRYIYSIFESQGANTNTVWVWNPNSVSFPNFDWNHSLMYYPGDEYVDIIGMTAYNTGTYYEGEKWQTFSELYDDVYADYLTWFGQPFMITEFSCSSVGGDKAAWMKDMFSKIYYLDRIKAAIWWDGCDYDSKGNIARSYFLDETPEIMDVFREGIKAPWDLNIYV